MGRAPRHCARAAAEDIRGPPSSRILRELEPRHHAARLVSCQDPNSPNLPRENDSSEVRKI